MENGVKGKFEPSFKFISFSDNHHLVFSTTNETLPELVSDFEDFLRGAGFVFDGHIIINEKND